jgi:hypothetical protein
VTASAWGSLRRRSGLRLGLLVITAAGFLGSASAALADSTTSVNWAGYAAHRSGVRFRSVTGEWRVPSASCTAGSAGYSSVWVGLGGYSTSSNALEQTGTEIDCLRTGKAHYFAWYELVPAAPHSISLSVRPGDLIRGTVSATRDRVTIALADLTDAKKFSKSFTPSQIDTTSAEWIVEAPSECANSGQCFTLPLADFGHANLSAASATTSTGRTGTIKSPWWTTTVITLRPHESRFFANMAADSAEAIPSALSAGGSAFTVTYQLTTLPGGESTSPGPFFDARASRPPVGQLVHPKTVGRLAKR